MSAVSGGLGYCVDCDEGAQLGGREALAACLSKNNNDKSKCTDISICNRDNLPHSLKPYHHQPSRHHLPFCIYNFGIGTRKCIMHRSLYRYKRMGCVPGSCKGRAQHTEKAIKWRRYDYSIHHGPSSSSSSSSAASASSYPFFRVRREPGQVW